MHSLRIFVALALFAGLALADDRQPPASWTLDRTGLEQRDNLDQDRFSALDLDALAAEDANREGLGEPPRFAWPHATAIRADQRGNWDIVDDIHIWRFLVHAEDATLINFGFEDLHLPEGSRLYIYSAKADEQRTMDRHAVIGPYDARINRSHREFWTPNLTGDLAIIEVNVPATVVGQFSLEIAQVSHGYRGFGESALAYRQDLENHQSEGEGKQACRDEGGTRSGACNQDVACLSDDDPWNDPRRSVGAYQRSGSFACTGSLVNNTANDQRMLFMTARHCISEAQASSIVVYWNYEWPTCRRPGATGGTSVNPPDPNLTNSGGTFLASTSNPFGGNCTASDECSDVYLLELNDPANPDFELHWSGWDRRPPPTVCAQGPGVSTEGLCATIHHPGVHEKRITWVAQDMQVGNIAGAQNIHWHPFWHPNPPELPNMPDGPPATIPPAVTEGGSSGSPLYSADRRLLGVLSGGPAFCGATGNSLSDFYGGLWHAWDGMGTPTTRMRDYLDPEGTAPLFIDGIDGDGFDLQPDSTSFSQCGFDDILINVGVDQLGDFDDPVTLSTSGLPGGISADFSVNPVTPPGSSTLTLSNLEAAGSGPFTFSLDGDSGDFDRSVNISVLLADESPQPAVINSPANGATGVSTSPTIAWSSDLGISFELEIATDAAFDNVVYSATVSDTSHPVDTILNSDTVYFVRVRSENDCGSADWSATISFTTASQVCIAPNLPIPDSNPAGINSDLVIAEGGELTNLEMSLDITHTWVGDLIINLTHLESGTSIELVNRASGSSATFGCSSENIQTGISDDAPVSLQSDCVDGGVPVAYPEDAYSPNDPLGNFIGVDLAGTWRLNVSDNAGGDLGTLNEWCLLPAAQVGDAFAIGGTVSGLEGSGLVLQNNGGDDLAISDNGSFEFDTPLFDGQAYEVSVAVHPSSPAQDCQVINGSGTVDEADVNDVEINCELASFSIGGTVSGLEGSGLILQNNGGDDLTIMANGSFQFTTPVVEGMGYEVTVATQPGNPAQSCSVANASGNVDGADVTDIEVTCEDQVTTLTGTVSSLGYCQEDPISLGSALVAVNGQNQAYSMATGANGLYQFLLPVDESPISITVSHGNHRSAGLSGLELGDQELIEQDFGLILREACARTDQDSLSFRLISAIQAQQQLVLSNALGGVDLTWSLDTSAGCYDPGEPGWLSLSHTGGLIGWGNERVITLSVDASGLAEGQYDTSLCFATSDPDNASIEVDVQLEIVGPDIFQDRFEGPE